MAEFTVRPAEPDDVDGIRRVSHDAWHAAHDDIVGSDAVDEVLAEYYDPESVRAGIKREETVYRVAVADDEVIGFAVGIPHEGETWTLGAIYVATDWWDEGVGSALLDAVEAGVREEDGERLRLHVMTANEQARRFYEARDYSHVADEYDETLDVETVVYARRV